MNNCEPIGNRLTTITEIMATHATAIRPRRMARGSGAGGVNNVVVEYLDQALLQQAVSAVSTNFPAEEEGAAEGIERCLAAMGDVDANANQANVLDCWVDDLAEIRRSGRPVRTGV